MGSNYHSWSLFMLSISIFVVLEELDAQIRFGGPLFHAFYPRQTVKYRQCYTGKYALNNMLNA